MTKQARGLLPVRIGAFNGPVGLLIYLKLKSNFQRYVFLSVSFCVCVRYLYGPRIDLLGFAELQDSDEIVVWRVCLGGVGRV